MRAGPSPLNPKPCATNRPATDLLVHGNPFFEAVLHFGARVGGQVLERGAARPAPAGQLLEQVVRHGAGGGLAGGFGFARGGRAGEVAAGAKGSLGLAWRI
jgi:hypothetical protein